MQYVRLSVNKEKRPLLQVRNLKKYFPIIKGFFNRVTGHIRAVDGVSFELHEGECLGLVELTEVHRLFKAPKHPYTESLLSAVPILEPKRKSKRILLSGEVADPSDLPSGCVFHPRCSYAEAQCREEKPEFREIEVGHFVRCHFAESLELESFE